MHTPNSLSCSDFGAKKKRQSLLKITLIGSSAAFCLPPPPRGFEAGFLNQLIWNFQLSNYVQLCLVMPHYVYF